MSHLSYIDAELEERNLNVLVVDDNEGDLVLAGAYLRQLPGWNARVYASTCATDAQRLARQREIDILLLDHDLGVETGLDLLTELRQAGVDAPAVLLTGCEDPAIVIRAVRAGVVDFYPKTELSSPGLYRSITNAVKHHRTWKELVSARENLSQLVDQLRSRNREILSFYHSLSHELKTPLTGAREFVALVLEGFVGEITEDQRDLLETASRSHDHMVVCINDMLDSARLDVGKAAFQISEHCLNELIEDVERTWSSEASKLGIDLKTELEAELPQASFDRSRVMQVFNNLISNALKFTDRGGRVTIRCWASEHPDHVAVSIEDTGRGIAQEKVARVFDRLFQAEGDDAAVQGGLGLGLNIAQQIIETSGGDLSVESQEGVGSTFTFTLPKAKALSPVPES